MKPITWLRKWFAYKRDCVWYRQYVKSGGEVFIIFNRSIVPKSYIGRFSEESKNVYPDLATEVQKKGSSVEVNFCSPIDGKILFTGEFGECSPLPVEFGNGNLFSEKDGANIYNDGAVCFSNHWAKFVFSDPDVVFSNNFLLSCAIATEKRTRNHDSELRQHFKELGIDFDELNKSLSKKQ